MHEIPREKLAEIIRTYGQIVTEDPRRVESLLRDFCPHHGREINLLVGAAREGVPADLLSTSGPQPLGALAQRLRADLGITDSAAQWAVESWALALGKVQASQLGGAPAKSHLVSGNALVDQGQFKQAAAEYREAIRLVPDYAEAYNNLGIALAEQGEMDAAVASFRQAVRLDPEDTESQTNLGNALLQLGRPAEAVAPLQEALRLNPDAPDVREALDRARVSQAAPAAMPETATPPEIAPVARSPIVPRPSAVTLLSALPFWWKSPVLRPFLLTCLAVSAAILVYHLHSMPASASHAMPPEAPAITPVSGEVTSDEETKFPVQWGQYTIVRNDVSGDAGETQQKISIQNADGQVLWETQDVHAFLAKECRVVGGSVPDFEVMTSGGGNNGDGTDYYFSRQNGLHLLFSCNTNEQGIVEFDRLDGASRQEIVYRYNLAFFDGLDHHSAGQFYCVYRWDGSQYVNVTSRFPQRAQAQGLEAQTRYLKSRRENPAADFSPLLDDTSDRGDAIEYWANFMAIGKGNEAKVWLLQHSNPLMRSHLLAIEEEIRRVVPAEGAKMDLTMGDGTILDKAAAPVSASTKGDATPSPETDTDTRSSSTVSPIDDAASALGTPVGGSSASTRDTMAAYAPAGSGLSDDPVSSDSLQNEALSADDLQGKSLRALSISHNTIFALHGCMFSRPAVKSYFESQPWYHPNPAFTADMLSPQEQKNVQTIREAEHARFGYGPPISLGMGAGRDPVAETATAVSGLSDRVLSLDSLQNSRLTDTDLEGKSLAALSISYNAIYAAHGYVFQRKSLQRVFGRMSWYHPNPAFAESDLSETEKANVQTIRAFERKRFGY